MGTASLILKEIYPRLTLRSSNNIYEDVVMAMCYIAEENGTGLKVFEDEGQISYLISLMHKLKSNKELSRIEDRVIDIAKRLIDFEVGYSGYGVDNEIIDVIKEMLAKK